MIGDKTQRVGIDLGTTNSVMAQNATALPCRISEGSCDYILPSVVAFPPSGETLIGYEALLRRAIDPLHTIVSAKRLIGVPYTSSPVKLFREHYPLELLELDSGVAFQTRGGSIRPRDVASSLVKELVRLCKVKVKGASAVVTVPAGFEKRSRVATAQAALQAGFEAAAIINEPVATALAYLERSNLRYAAVYDLGGGTFDFAIIDCDRYPFEVIAHGGDSYLGGDDIDREIAKIVREKTLSKHGWDLQDSPITWGKLLYAAEIAKVALGQQSVARIEIPEVDEAAPTGVQPVEITRDQVQSLALDLAKRSFVICDEVLGRAALKSRDIQAIFLAGGSTKLPGLRSFIENYFLKRPRFDIDPMHVVAIGASLAAARPSFSDMIESTGLKTHM